MKKTFFTIALAAAAMNINAQLVEATIDGLSYYLYENNHEAIVSNGNKWHGKLHIPSVITYDRQTYETTGLNWNAFHDCSELTNIKISHTIEDVTHYNFNYEKIFISPDLMNPFTGCTALESIEVAEDNPSMKSVDGVLFSKDGTRLYCYPAGIKATSYVVPQGVTWIGIDAIANANLKKIDLPESVQTICPGAFLDCALDVVIIRGHLDEQSISGGFIACLNKSAKLYVPASEVDRYKSLYSGTVLPLEEYEGRKETQEYFPEGTKWTEIRLDTLKYDSWYSKIGDEWVPNFETIEYRVLGIYSNFSETFGDNSLKCVYTNCSEWTDSLSLLIVEGKINEYLNYGRRVMATVPIYFDSWDVPSPAMAYNFDWRVGMPISFIDILSTTYDHNSETAVFGIIEEINEGNFGGVRPLNYTDVNGVRIIQGIGVTTWNDGECIFGPVRPYDAMAFHQGIVYPERHYRSMLVHFERDGEVLYDVWPRKGSTVEVAIDGLNYFLYLDRHEAVLTSRNNCSGEVDIPSEVRYNDETFVVKSMTHTAFHNNSELTKVRIPKTIEEIIHYYPVDPDWLDPPTGMANPILVNPFKGCTALESIEVDEENPCMKSIDGVLFSQDGVGQYYYKTGSYSGTGLYCYPEGVRQESYTIPESVEWIGGAAFPNNQYLTTLTIPNSMKHICYDAFSGCCNLTDVYCYAENVPIAWDGAFRNVPIASATLHVPAGSVDAYKATAPWSGFGDIVAIEEIAQEYFPEGTKWTEIRLDTKRFDSWYSKVGDEWVPNFETIEYRVQGEYTDHNLKFKKVYSNGPEWTDSLALLIYDNGYDKRVSASVLVQDLEYVLWPAEVYQFDWSVGKGLYYRDIMDANSTDILPELYYYGVIDEIKEGYFGGVRPLKYVDLNGKAPAMDDAFYDAYYHDTNGGRIIQGIGITEWNDGECLFGPPNPYSALSNYEYLPQRHYRSMLVHFERDGEVLYDVWPEKPHQPLPFLEGNPIWEYKYEHIPTPRGDDWMKCWVDTGDRSFTYYFLGGLREIDGKTYTMMGEIESMGEDITFNRWYPVREENGIVYTITDSLPGVVEHVYNDDYEIPYLQEGNECILYNFGAEIGDKLDKNNVVKSFDTYQLMDGTECRVLKTGTHYDLYEKIGYRDDYGTSGLMDPLDGIIISTNGHAYVNRLNAYFQDNKMLYKTPDAREGLCIDDTIWSLKDAYEYARSYKVDPRREEVFAYIQQLQKVTAWEVNIDGLSYLLDPDKHEAIISNGNKCSGELDIPSEVVYEGQTFVTKSMLWNAFYNCTGLTKVRIPKTIETVIHYYPGSILELPTSVTMLKASDYMNIFRGCLSLEAIEVDVDNPIMCSDNGVLFSKDKTCLYCYPAGISRESFTIPETVTRIGAYAISNNKCLVSLTIPGSVTQICGYTIMYCLALTDVYYPSEEVPVTSRFAFAGYNIPHATLHVPAESVDAYKSTAPWDFFGNIVALQNPVAFTEGQMATIVLPTEPDAGKGKYYRLDRVEGNEIIFEQEHQPRAHVPYIIVPGEDFNIEVDAMELEGLRCDTASVEGISFIGTFQKEEVESQEGFYIELIDTTPDCSLSPSGEAGRDVYTIGTLRAYLLVHWDDPYHPGGTKVPAEKMEIELKDNPNSIEIVNSKSSDSKCYDLSGKLVNRKSSNT